MSSSRFDQFTSLSEVLFGDGQKEASTKTLQFQTIGQ